MYVYIYISYGVKWHLLRRSIPTRLGLARQVQRSPRPLTLYGIRSGKPLHNFLKILAALYGFLNVVLQIDSVIHLCMYVYIYISYGVKWHLLRRSRSNSAGKASPTVASVVLHAAGFHAIVAEQFNDSFLLSHTI